MICKLRQFKCDITRKAQNTQKYLLGKIKNKNHFAFDSRLSEKVGIYETHLLIVVQMSRYRVSEYILHGRNWEWERSAGESGGSNLFSLPPRK